MCFKKHHYTWQDLPLHGLASCAPPSIAWLHQLAKWPGKKPFPLEQPPALVSVLCQGLGGILGALPACSQGCEGSFLPSVMCLHCQGNGAVNPSI